MKLPSDADRAKARQVAITTTLVVLLTHVGDGGHIGSRGRAKAGELPADLEAYELTETTTSSDQA